ncbi:hypothetical protein [Guptibacillus algicola]|uniref:hypothetical protein n=1 Tax=Guptibacillus algicola TaxID=225844 RepID=UPI001CD5C6E5|nr:hypothetical protein [Alkalihalobacillus algicola]MCA0987256.1 hypothetical protein [Alkalihalobacillus algicola]
MYNMYHSKTTTWKSYLFLVIALLTTLAMFLIDPISNASGESTAINVMIFILIGCAISILLAFVVFRSGDEKKGLASIALLLTIFNVSVTLYFIWIGISAA